MKFFVCLGKPSAHQISEKFGAILVFNFLSHQSSLNSVLISKLFEAMFIEELKLHHFYPNFIN